MKKEVSGIRVADAKLKQGEEELEQSLRHRRVCDYFGQVNVEKSVII